MNALEFEELGNVKSEPVIINIDDLHDKSDRTLIYGYTCSRDSWHVYIKDGTIHVLMYAKYGMDNADSMVMNFENCTFVPYHYRIIKVTENQMYIPDKRIYPTMCDFEFCKLLKERGVWLPFTGIAHNVDESKKQQYYGLVI